MSARNEVTGAEYKGKNVLRLIGAELEHAYDDAHGWAGFRQWLSVGRVVRKGEHGTSCLTVMTDKKDADGQTTGRGVRGFRVFHYDQTMPLEDAEQAAGVTPVPVVEPEPEPVAEVVPFGRALSHPTYSTAANRAMRNGFGWQR